VKREQLIVIGPLPPPHYGVTVSTSLVLANLSSASGSTWLTSTRVTIERCQHRQLMSQMRLALFRSAAVARWRMRARCRLLAARYARVPTDVVRRVGT
jgi:hypothetical protein